MDPRIEKLADVMVNYSLELKKGDWVKIQGIYTAMPLIKAFYRKALEAGAYPYYTAFADDLEEIFFKTATDDQLKFVSEIQKLEYNKLDALFAIMARDNNKYLTNIDPSKQAAAQGARRDLFKIFMERAARRELKWVGTMFPVLASAQDAEMSLSEYEDFVFEAGHLNDANPVLYWKELSAHQAKLVKYLESLKEIRVIALDTDLTVKIGGRKWINCDGKENFPDGEVFTTPIENSTQGHIHYTYPAFYSGHEVPGVRLEFKEGKVVDFSADKNLEYLQRMIQLDEGAARIGEFAIGTNYNITRFTKNTLFDEKIGGTIHLALGAAPPETGSTNHSAIHWDMVCEMREGGELYGDGKLIYKNGKFVVDIK